MQFLAVRTHNDTELAYPKVKIESQYLVVQIGSQSPTVKVLMSGLG